jgi:hypothetical protein
MERMHAGAIPGATIRNGSTANHSVSIWNSVSFEPCGQSAIGFKTVPVGNLLQ